MSVLQLHENEKNPEMENFLNTTPKTFSPFAPFLLAFCEALSASILKDPLCQVPEMAALAFWLRQSHLESMKAQAFKRLADGQIFAPRGLVFHIPPANVDPMFVYSWIVSLLMGNANIIRLPSAPGAIFSLVSEKVFSLLREPEFADIAASTCFVAYGHSVQITGYISSRAAVRMIWGGDETVRHIRSISLRWDAKELVFVDRYSYAAIQASSWLNASDEQKIQTAVRFFSDIYSFRQSACSSVKMIIWAGSREETGRAAENFYQVLKDEIVKRNYALDLSDSLQKRNFVYDLALSLPVEAVNEYTNELTVVRIPLELARNRVHCGRGLLFDIHVDKLADFMPFVQPKDQTLVQYGFSAEEIYSFLRTVNGQGILRVVKPGEALLFDFMWDGYSLAEELSFCIPFKV